MSNEGNGAPCAKESEVDHSAADFASLRSCLIGGNEEQNCRERRLRRRSLVLSTLLQASVLLAVIAIPFFSKAERITVKEFMPIPPYHATGERQHTAVNPLPAGPRQHFCIMCPTAPPNPIAPGERIGRNGSEASASDDPPDGTIGIDCPACIRLGRSEGPKPPPPSTPSVVHLTHIDPAMLLERVEPVYPALARQIRRDGRVELHAIISTDGTIEHLEAVSGDVIFYQSAIEAVRRWRYRPTMLNGQAVTVDTYITVIYTLER